MQFTLEQFLSLSTLQLQLLRNTRDQRTDLRGVAVQGADWQHVRAITVDGPFPDDHLYVLATRKKISFRALEGIGNAFVYDPVAKTSPVALGFEGSSESFDGLMNLSDPYLAQVLFHTAPGGMGVDDLQAIGVRGDKEGATAARFFMQANQVLDVPLSTSLWPYIALRLQPEPGILTEFDFRIEYIGKSINATEERLATHDALTKIQADLQAHEDDREVFAFLYQVDFDQAGLAGVGSRAHHLELRVVEALLIQHFKPRFNIEFKDFTLTGTNGLPTEKNLADQMRASKAYPLGGTQVRLDSPASRMPLCLGTGRFYTEFRKTLVLRETFCF